MRTVIAALAVLAVAGCGTGQAATPRTPQAAAPSPSATPAGPAALGTTQSRTDEDITVAVTVYHVRTVKSHADVTEPSHRFLGIDVRVCATKAASALTLGQQAWAVDYSDDTEATPISEWWDGEFSVPLYPVERRVVAGQCARGWVMFKPLKGRASHVTYAPGGNGEPAFWGIP